MVKRSRLRLKTEMSKFRIIGAYYCRSDSIVLTTNCTYSTARPLFSPMVLAYAMYVLCVNFTGVPEALIRFLLWPPYVIGQAIIFLPCGFYLLLLLSSSFLFLFFSSTNLSGRRSDVYHTSTHGLALVRI